MGTKSAAIARYRPFGGPALFAQGFRPFFLGAGLWSVVAVALWLAVAGGAVSIPTAFDPIAWHAHEMTFGFAAAVVAGFLLTAIPNWTGRMPLQGRSLIVLFGTWCAGRAAMAVSAPIGFGVAAVLDLSFLTVLLAVVAREIVAGRNWRNLPMPVALAGLLVANGLSHAEAAGLMPPAGAGLLGVGQRLGIAIVILLIGLIGGRIIPSFTRNWLAKRDETRLPASFDRFDRVCLILTAVALAAWVAAPDHRATGAALVVAGLASLARMVRWRGLRTLSEPLVWSLHLGFAWVPAGLCLLGIGAFLPALVPSTAGLHALTAGAVGSMTLAVMTRATLGHTGRALSADGWTAAIYALVSAAAVARVAAPLAAGSYELLLWASGLSWIAAFALFTVRYGRMLVAR